MLRIIQTACLLACLAAFPAAAEQAPPAAKSAAASNPVIVMETSLGPITIELDASRAPLTVKNFLDYADAGFYTGTVFHRVIPGFMIQAGGFTPDMRQKPTKAAIKNEAQNGLSNKRGTIAMARTPVVDSATSQFFINLKDNVLLDYGVRDYGYAVFGKVVAGMETVDKIAALKTGTRAGHQNVPLEPVIITGVARKN